VWEEEEAEKFREMKKALFPPQKMGPLSRGQELRQEARSEVSATVQDLYGPDIDGEGLWPALAPYWLRETTWRRRHIPSVGPRWGPFAAFWHPFRYIGAIPRVIAFEAALAVLIVGLIMVGGGLTSGSAIGLCRGVGLGALVMAIGALAVGACAAGIEDWAEGVRPPLLWRIYDNEDFEDDYGTGSEPVFLLKPLAPGPLRGWEWGEWARRATCPRCTTHGLGGASAAFHNWYALFPPIEWNRGLWRYVEPGHRSGDGVVPPGLYGPQPHTRHTGAGPSSLGDQTHPVDHYLSENAWWRRGADLCTRAGTRPPRPAHGRGARAQALKEFARPYLPAGVVWEGKIPLPVDKAPLPDTELPPINIPEAYQAHLDEVARQTAPTEQEEAEAEMLGL